MVPVANIPPFPGKIKWFFCFFNLFQLFIVGKDAMRPRFAGGGFAASVASLTLGDFFRLLLRRERRSLRCGSVLLCENTKTAERIMQSGQAQADGLAEAESEQKTPDPSFVGSGAIDHVVRYGDQSFGRLVPHFFIRASYSVWPSVMTPP